jgi:hypothetical protein
MVRIICVSQSSVHRATQQHHTQSRVHCRLQEPFCDSEVKFVGSHTVPALLTELKIANLKHKPTAVYNSSSSSNVTSLFTRQVHVYKTLRYMYMCKYV